MRDKKGGWEIKTMKHNNSKGRENDVSKRKNSNFFKTAERVENSNEIPDDLAEQIQQNGRGQRETLGKERRE